MYSSDKIVALSVMNGISQITLYLLVLFVFFIFTINISGLISYLHQTDRAIGAAQNETFVSCYFILIYCSY